MEASTFNDTLLARALQKAANPIFIVDKLASLVWCNSAYAEMKGQPIASLLRKPVPSLTPTRETAPFFSQLWSMVMAGDTWMGELQERRVDGAILHMDSVFTPLTDASGRPTLFLVLEHDVTKRKVEYEKVWTLANYDRLTGLANRSFFSSTLELIIAQSLRNNKVAAVLFIDLDNFKVANDNFGHDAGDWVLIQTAEALRGAVRKSDTVARFGGDEFACILDDVETVENAQLVAEKIIAAIRKIELCDASKKVQIGASVGIALFPFDGMDQSILRNAADMAMYAAKRAGKNCWRRASDANEQDRASAVLK